MTHDNTQQSGNTQASTPANTPAIDAASSGLNQPATAWLKTQARGVRRSLGLSIACGTVSTILLCLQAALLAWCLNAAIFEDAPVATLIPAASGFVLLAVVRVLLSVAGRHFSFQAGRYVVTGVRAELTSHLQALGPLWLAKRSRGELVTRLVDGVNMLEPYFVRYLPQLAAAVVLPLVVLVAAFPADWMSALVLLLTAPLVPLFMLLLGDRAARASQRRWVVLTRLGEQFFDALQGLVTLRLFGAGERERALLAAGSEAYRHETMAVLRVAFLSSLVLEFFATLSIAAVAVLVGFRLLWGDVEFARGMFVLLLAPEFFLPLRALGALRHARMDALAVAGDVAGLLDEPLPNKSMPTSITEAMPMSTPMSMDGSRLPLVVAPRIIFEHVSFQYDKGRTGLEDVLLDLAPGTTTAIVGDSGAGKSTLLLALLGFVVPRQGHLRIDDVDLAALDPDAWRQRLAWLPQRPHLFVGSLRENLVIANPQADEIALHQAAAAAGLDAVIASLPSGWDTPLGDNGFGLSGGQAQRIGLARVFLRDVPVWLLDEPTQHLDSASATVIERTLSIKRAGRTVVQITHRLEAARSADRIAVMRGGSIVEYGQHEELQARGGAYARLLKAQSAA